MERSLLDTDILSEVLRGRDPNVVSKAKSYLTEFGHFTTSVITLSEIVDGLQRQLQAQRIADFLAEFESGGHEVLALDAEAALLAGKMLGDLHRTGQSIGQADPFIAAIATIHGIPLVTGNTKHFQRIQDLGYSLRLDNWKN